MDNVDDALSRMENFRLFLPESNVNFEQQDQSQALQWVVKDDISLQLEATTSKKQNIFVSSSEINFPEKWYIMQITEVAK